MASEQHHLRSKMLPLLVMFLLVVSANTQQMPFSYTVSKFDAATLKDWNVFTTFQTYADKVPKPQPLNPNAARVLRLTSADGDIVQSALAVYNKQIPWGKGFIARFSFRLYDAGVNRNRINGTKYDPTNPDVGGDGITFAVFSTLPKQAGGYGGALGYFNGDAAALSQSMAIEFDTWHNPECMDPINEGGVVGGDTNHIGMDLRGQVISEKAVHIDTPFNDGGTKNVWVIYFPEQNTLQVFYNDIGSERPASPVLTAQIDLNQVLGTDTQAFYAGFTGASATAYEEQTIISFSIVTLNGTEEPIKPLPQPAPIPDPAIMILQPGANYANFQTKDWVPGGSATVMPGGALQLTVTDGVVIGPNKTPLADPGQATLQKPLDCAVGCSIYGAFAITNDVRLVDASDLVAGGDGLAMLLTATPVLPPVENTPGNLGYAGIKKSVAVEVDTWYDKKIDPVNPKNRDGSLQLSGSDGNHLGVSVGGNLKSIATVHLPGPANDNELSANGARLRIKHVWVDVDNLSKEIKVFFNEVNGTKPMSPTLTAPVDLDEEVGGTQVYLSFTASTSTGLSNHFVLKASVAEAMAILNTASDNNTAVTAASFPTFDSSTSRAFMPAGTATNVTTDTGALTLTNTSTMDPAAGTLALIAPINIADGMQVKFSPRMISNPGGEPDPADGSTARDGMALLILSEKPSGPGQPGSGIGYGGLPKSVAVELDTFYNSEHDPTGDGNHVGINLNGDLKSVASASIPDDMADGRDKFVWVDYDAQDKVARVYYSFRDAKPAVPILTHPIDLLEALGTTTPYLLITGGTNGTAGTPGTNELSSISFLNAKPPPPEATNLTKFDEVALRSLARGGVAAGLLPTADGALPLTSGLKGPQAGLVRVGPTVDISKGLAVHVQVVLDGKGGQADPSDTFPGRDGVAILLTASNATTPGQPAGGIGYAGLPNTVAVELDSFYNAPHDPVGDGNHIGVNANGNLKSLTTAKLPGNLNDGKPRDVWLDYNNVAKSLSVYYNADNATKPATPILTQVALNLPVLLKSTKAYVAITSGTDSTSNGPTPQVLKSVTITPGNPDATKPRSFDFADPAAATAWEGGFGAGKNGLALTDPTAAGPQFGATVLKVPLDVSDGFSAYIQVSMTAGGGTADPADKSTGPSGIAILLMPTNETHPAPSVPPADSMGYAGMAKTVAVELDTFYNAEWDPVKGANSLDGNHVGVNVNGSLQSVSTASISKDMADGTPKHVWVDYSSVQKLLKVYVNPASKEKPLDPVLTASVDIEEVLGTSTPYVAVTSGTTNPRATALLKEVLLQPGRADATTAFSGPNSISKLDAAGLQKLARSGAAASLTAPNADGSVPLTNADVKDPQSSMVVLPAPVDLSQGLSSHFQIKMTSPAGANVDAADGNPGTGGAAIVILPSNAAAQGAPDSGLGYKDIPGKSAAVELDKYYDQGVPDPVNPHTDGLLQVQGADGNHIGLNFDGSVVSTQTTHIPRDFNSDVPNNVWLDYDPAGKLFVYFNGPNATKPAAPVLTAGEDLVTRLGGPKAYIAITGATTNASTAVALVSSRMVNVAPVPPTEEAMAPPAATVMKDFNVTTAAAVKVVGAAATVAQPDATRGMKLTDSSLLDPQSSLLVVSPRVDISHGLMSRFQFVLAANDQTDDLDPADNLRGRDGVAIILLGSNNITQGEPAGGLGYGGLNKTVIVELDSWYDAWDPLNTAGLPDGNHIGINTNGQTTSLTSAPLTTNLNNGVPKNVWVDVDSIAAVLYVYFDEAEAKPAEPLLAVPLDVVGTLGTDHPVLAVTSGAQGRSSVTGQFLKMAEFASMQPKAELALKAQALPKMRNPSGKVQSRSFNVFNPDTLEAFDLVGKASSTSPDSYLRLNDPTQPDPQSGMAIYKTPLDASTGFSVYVQPMITASMTAPTDPADNWKGRDGLAVVFMASNNSMPGPDASNSGLGYAGLKDTVAVELDSWMDTWDKDGNHVGINKGGNQQSEISVRLVEDLNNGKDKHLWVDYDNTAKAMNVFMSQTAAKPVQPVLFYPIDLPMELGTDQPFVAVTSSTRDAAAEHTVKALSFRSGEAAANPKTRSFSSFTPDVLQTMQLSGSAVSDPFQPGAIALTTDQPGDQAGLVKLSQAVNLAEGVSAFIQFQMNNTARVVADPAGGPMGGDGMVLILLGESVDAGAAGSGMGYKDIKGKSLGMELDAFYNKDVDPENPEYPWGVRQLQGSDGNHLGLDVDGDVKSVMTSTVPLPFNDGGVHSAWLDCDNVNKMLHMYYNPDNDTKPALPTITYTLEQPLTEMLGTTAPILAVSAGSTDGATVHRLRSIAITEGSIPNPYSFPSANGIGWQEWSPAGSATTAARKLQLTHSGQGAQAGRAVLPKPFNMTNGLSVMFVADIQSAEQAQDGLALAFVNTAMLQEPQGYLGYSSLKKSVAVELDPFYNDFDPKDTPLPLPASTKFQGPDGNHVGINVNGNQKSAAAVHIREPLASGPKFVWVDYDNVAKSMWVYVGNSSTKPQQPVLSHSINVEKTLGTKWPYVAFTSSSDGNSAISVRAVSVQPGKPVAGPKTKRANSSKKLSGGAIAGLVIGILAAVLILALLVWWLCNNCECCRTWGFGKRKQRKADPLYVV